MPNQNPEQKARDLIDAQLRAAGWSVQDKKSINFNEGEGQAIREYQTDTGPADFLLFLGAGKPVGIIEAKKEDLGHALTTVEDQTKEYGASKLKWIQKSGEPLPFLYESTGTITRFTDQRDPKPRSREVFTFLRPETLREYLTQGKSLRARLQDLPVLDPTDLRLCQVNAITNEEISFKAARLRSLIQMATGSGKTFTAITFIKKRCPSSTSTSSSSMNATAPTTTSGGRFSNTSTPSSSASPPPRTTAPSPSSSRTSSRNTPTSRPSPMA